MKIKDIFDINQGHQITDEEIYRDIINGGKVPIITANNEIKGLWNKTIVNPCDLPCLTYPTKANSGTCFLQKKIFDANNTAVLVPKKEWISKIDLNWFSFKLSKMFPKVATSKEGVNYLNREIVEELDIVFPGKNVQDKEYRRIEELTIVKGKIDSIREKIKRIKNLAVIADYKIFQAKDVPVKIIFDCVSGNSGLTEEYLYQNTLLSQDKKYTVLTGGISIENCVKTDLCAKPKNKNEKMTVFSGEGIHVVRKGRAGTVNYLKNGNYTLNDDAYIIKLKNALKYKLLLKWVVISYSKLFAEYASSSDNSTWNKSSFFKHATIDIPSIKEQEEVVKRFAIIEEYEKKIAKVYQRIESILSKEVV